MKAPKRRYTWKQFFTTATFCVMATGILVMVYGVITLPFWWKAEYFYSTRMAIGIGILNTVTLGSVFLLEKLSPFKDKP